LLCSRCNARLALLEDEQWIEKAMLYLERFKLNSTEPSRLSHLHSSPSIPTV
jgi:hypothetical protein